MNVRIDKDKDKEKTKKSENNRKKKYDKPQKEKRVRTPKESTALMLGLVALLLAAAGIAALLCNLPLLVSMILGGIAVLTGFSGLMVGKGGTLPAVIAIVGGFLTILSAIISMKLG